MANIRVDLNETIKDGSEIVFRSPADCSAITGLIVYYAAEDGTAASKEFVLADAHGHNVGDIDHLFAENVVVKVILDVTHGMAYVQNADTNAYIERTFIKTVNGVEPDENGNVSVHTGVKDGFSPIAKVTETADGVEISVTDEKGTTTATVKHGKDGEDGKPFVYDDLTEEQKDDMKPARGKDYWTEDDVAQMEAYLDKAVGQKVQIITWEADD